MPTAQIWNGGAWVEIQAAASAHDHSGTSVANTPAGNIAATTVQAALNELDSEKVAVTLLTASGKGFVNHGATAGTARPSGYASVEWFGTVQPTNWIDGDTWNNPT